MIKVEEEEKVTGRERKPLVEVGVWSTSIGSDDWRLKGGVVNDLPYRERDTHSCIPGECELAMAAESRRLAHRQGGSDGLGWGGGW